MINLEKASRRLLNAAKGDHELMVDRGDGHHEFELDLAISELESALAQQAEPVEGQAEPVVAVQAEPVAVRALPVVEPVRYWRWACAVCGIGADGRAMGYVCPRGDCPTQVRSGTHERS